MQKKEIHVRLKAARKAAGFKSANDFADAIGVPRTTYSQHERGDRNIKDDSFENYCKHLKINEAWLRSGAGAPFNTTNKVQSDILNQELRSHDIYKKLNNPDTQTLDLELLKAISSLLFEYIQKEKLSVSPDVFAETLTEIYNSIATTSTDVHQRLQMLPAVIKPYLKMLAN